MLVQGNRLSLFLKAKPVFQSSACFYKHRLLLQAPLAFQSQTMAVEKKYILLQNMRPGTAEII